MTGLAQQVLTVLLSTWMVVIAWLDHRDGRIPNTLTAPFFLGIGALRLFEGLQGNWTRFLLLPVWAVIFGLWMLHFIGGGDAKFLMALYALFPNMEFTGVLAFILLILTIPLLSWELRGRTLGAMGRGMRDRVLTGQLLPTETDLHSRGRRYAWTFALPALVYVWVYWDKFQ